MESIVKIQPDRERARSLIKLAKLRYEKIKTFEENTYAPLILEGYYEVIKELITSILFIDGYKTLSHKDLIEYLDLNFNKYFTKIDIKFLDQLRVLRNKIVYYGEEIESSYIKRNKSLIMESISKLTKICEMRLK